MADVQPRSVIDVLVEDHREVERLFERALATDHGDERRDIADRIITELVQHSIAEEEYLYPAVRNHLDDGDRKADHEIEEHNEVEQLMKQLEGVQADDPRLLELLRQLESDVSHHVEEEERDVFPQLRDRIDAARLVELGEKVQRAKQLAPTRPHPHAPNSPTLLKTLGPGVGLVDRLRDRMSQFGR